MKINCKLLGNPEIFIDGKEVLFPYSKINGFIYYMLMEKNVSRSEISGLLWPDDTEKIGKKNLRNALYHGKKNLTKDFILSPNNRVLQLNEDLDIYIDAEEFLKNPEENLNLYDGEFLKGFYLKDSRDYEDWVFQWREEFLSLYYSTYYEQLKYNISMGIYENVESGIKELISIDDLDEKNYRLLMDYYLKTGRASKVIEVYSDLKEILSRELNVEPDNETKVLYNKSLEKFDTEQFQIEEKRYYGREEEIAFISNFISDFKDGNSESTLYISGEIGVGKSTLLDRVFSDISKDEKIIKIYCYQIEKDTVLRPIEFMVKKISELGNKRLGKDILEEIKEIQLMSTMNSYIGDMMEILEDKILKLFSQIEEKDIIINFEDIHWMDRESYRLLGKIILKDKNFMYFLSGRDSLNYEVEDLVSTLYRYKKIKEIKLEKYTMEESLGFLRKFLKEDRNLKELVKIYEEAEGSPFFLNEFINLINNNKSINTFTQNMENSIRARFAFLSEEERELIEIVSIFKEGFPLDFISELIDFPEEKIVKTLNRLLNRKLLEEKVEKGNIIYKFTHKKVKEYLYLKNSKSFNRFYHKKIGNLLEKSLGEMKTLEELERLLYHFSRANDKSKELEYKIDILNHNLNFSHELFPVFEVQEDYEFEYDYMQETEIEEKFSTYLKELENIENSEDENSFNLEIKLFYMRGRYLIRKGIYREALEDINFVIKRSRELNLKDYELSGYKQMIFYNIQINNPYGMSYYIDKALDLAVNLNYHKEIGMLLRMKGIHRMMVGEYKSAEESLNESISIFSVNENISKEYSTNIAAAHNYIGELKFTNFDFEGAAREIKLALSLTRGKKAYSSLSIFYINLGKIYYGKGEYRTSRRYFDLASELFNNFDSDWKRGVLESYMALIEVESGNSEKGKIHMKKAFEYKDIMKDPRNLGTVNFAAYLIKEKELEEFENLLLKDKEYYKTIALENLDRYRDRFEIEILK